MSDGNIWDKLKNLSIDSSFLDSLSTPAYSTFMPELTHLPDIKPLPFAEHMEKTEVYQEKSLQILQSIENNTANLFTLVDLINRSTDKQDELIDLITDILSISKAQTKEEAGSAFRKTMEKINATVKDADSLMKLASWAPTIFKLVFVITAS